MRQDITKPAAGESAGDKIVCARTQDDVASEPELEEHDTLSLFWIGGTGFRGDIPSRLSDDDRRRLMSSSLHAPYELR